MARDLEYMNNPPLLEGGFPLFGSKERLYEGVPSGACVAILVLRDTLPEGSPREETEFRAKIMSAGDVLAATGDGRKILSLAEVKQLYHRCQHGPMDQQRQRVPWSSNFCEAVDALEKWCVARLGGDEAAQKWTDIWGYRKPKEANNEAKLLAEAEAAEKAESNTGDVAGGASTPASSPSGPSSATTTS